MENVSHHPISVIKFVFYPQEANRTCDYPEIFIGLQKNDKNTKFRKLLLEDGVVANFS